MSNVFASPMEGEYEITLKVHPAVEKDTMLLGQLVQSKIDQIKSSKSHSDKVINSLFSFQTDKKGHLTY